MSFNGDMTTDTSANDFNSNSQYDAMSALKRAIKDYKPWHEPHWYSTGAKDPLPVLLEMAERLGLASPDKPEELGITGSQYDSVRKGGELSKKDRKKLWTGLKIKTGLREPKKPSGVAKKHTVLAR